MTETVLSEALAGGPKVSGDAVSLSGLPEGRNQGLTWEWFWKNVKAPAPNARKHAGPGFPLSLPSPESFDEFFANIGRGRLLR